MVYNDEHRYDYMLNMPHHQSKKHKQMSMSERAAQFGAFRALTGYEEAIYETGRLTEEKIELDDYIKEEINLKLKEIAQEENSVRSISVTYFVADERKEGGAYITYSGEVLKIRQFEKDIIFTDGTKIPINDIIGIEY